MDAMRGEIHICRAQTIGWKVTRRKCPNCGKRRMLLEWFEWYPPILSCLNCGDRWSEDGRQERPFMRGWREQAIAELKKHLADLKAGVT